VSLAADWYADPGVSFEQGIGQAMLAVLSSPRFLFRIEQIEPLSDVPKYPLIDEYSLASRLSYFLWSTMPDDELLEMAERRQLRANLPQQLARMIQDARSNGLVTNFVGQWLQARDVETVAIDYHTATGRKAELETLVKEYEEALAKNNGQHDERAEKLRDQFIQLAIVAPLQALKLRAVMREESEMYFEYVLREDRSLLELIDSNYTFLNEALAKHYAVDGVQGDEMRRVDLPPDSPRGGILTQGTILLVTSNPTRTSPVKRGLFVLENILGTPPPPPPANVAELEEAAKEFKDRQPTLRETLELHRRNEMCSSCHNQMDPLGLGLENFNALGIWRDSEQDQPIDASGQLITGEVFHGVRELKKILAHQRRSDVYRCLSEKMFTYALGRGLEYHDEHTMDQIVEQLEQHEGKPSVLITAIVQSAAFQRQRPLEQTRPGEPP
jgi:hypothetical protein